MDLKYTELNDLGFGLVVEIEKTLCSEITPFQRVDIFKTKGLGNLMTMDGLVMTSEWDDFFYHEMISHIPLNAHKAPKNVLIIGGGDGGTVREILKHDCVEKIVLCEIDGKAVDLCKEFLPTISSGLNNPKVEIVIEDGVKFISDKNSEYDVVLIDSTDPLGPGIGLFTKDFYTNVKKSLKPGAIVVAQSESPIADKKEMKAMYSLLKNVFPICKPYFGNIPTYPAGFWSWAFCSIETDPFKNLDEKRVNQISQQCKLYNIDIHKACFAIPNYVRRLLEM